MPYTCKSFRAGVGGWITPSTQVAAVPFFIQDASFFIGWTEEKHSQLLHSISPGTRNIYMQLTLFWWHPV